MRIGIIIIALLLAACTQHWEPVCRHKALMAAALVGERYPTRIARGPSGPGTYHAQAQAYIAPDWVWLCWQHGWVYVGDQDEFTPTDYWPVWAYVARFFPDRWGGLNER